MGKKRRILTRTTKFAKKYFEFLDRSDGQNDDLLLGSQIQAYVDTLKAIDNQNQTVALEGRLVGFATDDKIQWSVNGGDWKPDLGAAIIDVPGGGLDRLKIDPAVPVTLPDGAPLPKGSHKIAVRKLGETNESLHKSTTVDVRENKIALDLAAGCFSDSGDNNIAFDSTKVTITEGKKTAGDANDAVLGGGGADAVGIRISITQNGAAQSLVGPGLTKAVLSGATFTDGSADIAEILEVDADDLGQPLHDDVANDGDTIDYVVTVVPVDSQGTPLEDSAVTQTVTVEKVA